MESARKNSSKKRKTYTARRLLAMWMSPRMVAWFFVSMILIALPRLVFFPAQALPYCIQFNPGCAMIPVCGIVFGPAGAWGGLAATILVDAIIGMASGLTVFRALGVFLFAISAQVLWGAFRKNVDNPPSGTATAFRFVMAAFPGMIIHAVWVGFGSEWLRLYSFPYVTLIALIQNLVFVPLVGIPVMPMMRRIMSQRGDWLVVLSGEPEQFDKVGKLNVFCIWCGASGALLAGSLTAYWVYHISPFTALNIGVTDCPWTLWAVAPFLLLQLYGLFSLREPQKSHTIH